MAWRAPAAWLAALICLSGEIAHAATGTDSIGLSGSRPAARSERAPEDPLAATLRDLYGRTSERLWSGGEAQAARRALALALLAREARLDPSVGSDARSLAAAFAGLDGRAELAADRALSRAWLAYLMRRRATTEPVNAQLALHVLSILEASSASDEMDFAVVELAVIEALGGWRPVAARLEPEVEPAAIGAEDGEAEAGPPRRRYVVDSDQLTRRLIQSLDLPARHLASPPKEAVLVQAVRRFQRRHGLAPDGVVGARTLAALNQPVATQLATARLNAARAKGLALRNGLRRYVEVNIPAFELRLVENGVVSLRSRVIVGDDKTPTPIFEDVIRYVEIDPAWYVPPSIVGEVLDRERREPGYLERAGFTWRTRDAGRPQLIQRPGPENALGRFKFVFPNHHAVYLHDTAQRGLFGRADQALSHGCVRVERPLELALALLREQGWDASRLDQALATRRTRRIELAEPVPIFLDYRTADLDGEGRLRILFDLYGRDDAARASLSGKWPSTRASKRDAGSPPDGSNGRLAAAPTVTVLD